jgi:ankyrin repeat protein
VQRTYELNREAILLLVVDRCNATAVRQFIEVGASMEITDPKNDPTATALHSCVLTGDVEIAQLLIEIGVKVRERMKMNCDRLDRCQ